MVFDLTLNLVELNNFVKHKLFEFEDGTQSQVDLERIFIQSSQHVTKFIKILYKDDMLKYSILYDSYSLQTLFRALSTLTPSNLFKLDF